MYNIKLFHLETEYNESIKSWVKEELTDQCRIIEDEGKGLQVDIVIAQISTPFDWVKVNRLRKKHLQSKIFVIMNNDMVYTSPIAVELNVHTLQVTPLRKNLMIRALHTAMDELNDLPIVRETFLRRLMYGEIKTQEELEQYKRIAKFDNIPNVLCLLQGNESAQAFIENEEGQRILRSHVRSVIKNHLSHWINDVSYVSFSKYFAVMFHIPFIYKSIREWDQLNHHLLKLIDEIHKEYGITLHVGVGSVYNNPLCLNKPYQEAKKALNHSLTDGKLLCFYEELTKDQNLQKCIEYISNYYHEDLSIKKVANKVHLSHTYFSRLFKKELGISFVEYVTNIRIKRAKWLLSHTNDTIEAIAAQVGFNTPNYFSSIFKKHVGVSPSEYREAHIITVND
ncbi:helix-turn-helix domain-containing protein [Bacillus solimangrovi]|uniref:Two-component response regulator n=1 Tax=Bacillus solimangrovi TaxID=1305675 RepID=A0A1E5LD12_9BACI|nr:helix-turn-helix domain-containing protein [Bacillus solimangrovi]OEH91950.1 two-component response regulator [Bacillus solimangrovi]